MKKFLFTMFFVLMFAGVALAQGEAVVEIDLSAIQLILVTGVGGFAVGTLTEMIKRALKAKGLAAYGISLLVSAAATASFMVTIGWDLLMFVVYTILVFGSANGFYKIVKKP